MNRNPNFILELISIIEGNSEESINNVIMKFYPNLIIKDDTNRISIFNDTIFIAKNREGNKENAHEKICSEILREYTINHFYYKMPYFNMTHGIIVKPVIIPFDKEKNSNNLMAYQIYGTTIIQKVFSMNSKQNKIGVLNGKLVLSDYRNFIPYMHPLICSCGNFAFGGLEPWCQCESDLNLNSNIKILEFRYLQNLKNYIGELSDEFIKFNYVF